MAGLVACSGLLVLNLAVNWLLGRLNKSYRFLAEMGWLFVVSGLRVWRQTPMPGVLALFLAGACWAYLFMPLVHHVVGTDGYFYITDSDNFFAQSILF